MKIDEKLLEFLKITNIQQLIAQNKFDKIYKELLELNSIGKDISDLTISEFTNLIYKADIDPLLYMNKIPTYFHSESSISSFNIPNNIIEIGQRAFYWCSDLKTVIIPDSVTKIEGEAFCGCYRLANIDIPDSVNHIGMYAFAYCRELSITCHSERVKNLIIKSNFRNKDKIILTK